MTDITIYDSRMTVRSVLSNNAEDACPYWGDKHFEDLKGELWYQFYCPSNHEDSSYIEKNGYVSILNKDGQVLLFQVNEVDRGTGTTFVTGENAAVDDLHDKFIRPAFLQGYTAKQAVDYVLQNTDWQAGVVEWLGVNDFEFNDYPNALDALKSVAEKYDGELHFYVQMVGNRIVGRYIDMLEKRGTYTGKEFTYSKDIIEIRRISSDRDELVTGLIGLGPSSSEGGRMTFTSVNVSDKPLGDDFILDNEALNKWGIKKHKLGVYEYSDAQTPEELLIATRKELKKRSTLQLKYVLRVILLESLTGYEHENVRLGDTVSIIDKSIQPEVEVSARVLELTRSYSNPGEDVAVLGNFKPLEERFRLEDLQKRVANGEGLWKANYKPPHFGPTPPADTTKTWLDTSGGQPYISYYFDGDTWVPAGPTTAGHLGAYTIDEVDGKYEASKDLVQAWKNPDTNEIHGNSIATGSLSFGKARGGIIHLGQEGGGELRVFTFNSDGLAEPIGEIVLEGASFPLVNTEYINAPNKLETMEIDENVYPVLNYYVDNVNGSDENTGLSTGAAKRTIQAVLNSLPRFLAGEIIIEMRNTGVDQEEDLDFKGFVGDGKIVIKSESGTKKLLGTISLRHCTIQIIFTECSLKCSHSADIHVKSETCSKVEFEGVKFLGENKANDGVRGYYSHILVRNCQFDRYLNAAITSARGNLMAVENCSGDSNKYGVWAYSGGVVTGGGTAPKGTVSQTLESNANIIPTFTNNAGTPPPDPVDTTETVTKYYNATDSGAWRENYGGQWNKSVPYQGEYNGWGRYRGLWFHGSQLSHLSGKNIKSMKIKVKRDSKGGTSGGVNVVFRTHNYTSQPAGTPSYSSSAVTSSFSWGQEKWVDVTSLKTAFQNGTAKGFAIYTTSSSNSDYAIFTGSCQVKVTYEE